MKKIITLLSILITKTALAATPLVFDGDTYHQVREDVNDTLQTTEYLRTGESIDKWTKMLTVRQYPEASKIKQVFGIYLKSVIPMLALKPDIYGKKSSHKKDVIAVMLLLSPDKSYYEYIIHRFISDDSYSVTSFFFSYKIPFKEELDASFIIENKNKWMIAISNLDVPRLKMNALENDDDEDSF